MPSTSTASYTAASNQVSSVNGGAGLSYDAAGDVTQDPLNSYLYDAEGRLCAAKTAGPSLTGYIYDASGTRVAKGSLASFSCNFAANGFTPTSSYVLGPGGEQVTEYAVSAGASTWVHTNAFDGGHLQATYHDTGTYFYLGDWLGTKRVEVGASGCAAAFTSLPYGDGLTTVALPGYSSCIDATEHHFTGKERDTESGNDYFGARYYAAAMGRFMSPDWSAKVEPVPYAKMDDPQSLNLYAYVRNNPLTSVDLDGHQSPCGGSGQPPCSPPQPPTPPSPQPPAPKPPAPMLNPTPMPSPNLHPVVTAVSDALGIASAVTKNTPLGVASSLISVANDPSLKNIATNLATTVVTLAIPALSLPIAAGTAAYDGADLIVNQGLAPMFNAAPPQKINADGYSLPNPALMDGSEFITDNRFHD